MKRCSRCLMPASLPGSNFNEKDECYWCQTNYPSYQPKGRDKLESLLDGYRGQGREADCLVGISGGKDSSYVLMEMKETYGMRVEAFTYTHDGATQFSLNNAKNVSSKFGIKHHIVSLPEHKHLEIFRSFFKVWLKSQTIIPAAMTCVACKHMHILSNKIAFKRGIPLLIWANCPIEDSPFIAIKLKATGPDKQFEREGMAASALRLAGTMASTPGLASGFLRNISACVNGCLALTPKAKSLGIRFPNQKQVFYFHYCDWNPVQIEDELISRAGWKPPEGVADDWHSDCIFHIIKEYMFQKMLGVSYTDGFLSNQIRRGILSREIALIKLLASKRYFAAHIIETLGLVNLEQFADQIDISCFDISDD